MVVKADAKIYVAGHRGLVGSALVRALRARGHENLILRNQFFGGRNRLVRIARIVFDHQQMCVHAAILQGGYLAVLKRV